MVDRDNRLWFGSIKVLRDLEEDMVNLRGGDPAKLQIAARKLLEYQHMMLESSSQKFSVIQPDGTTKDFVGKGKGNRYRDVAHSLVSFYNQTSDITDTLDDTLDKVAGPLMEIAAFLQLGGSVATAMINLVSLGTHAIPYLSTFNKKTGYGGGYNLEGHGGYCPGCIGYETVQPQARQGH